MYYISGNYKVDVVHLIPKCSGCTHVYLKWIFEPIYNLLSAYLALLSEVNTTNSLAYYSYDKSSTSLALSSLLNSYFNSTNTSLLLLRAL